MIRLEVFNEIHCGALADILSTYKRLHGFLTKRTFMKKITAEEYYQECRAWEKRKPGKCFAICLNNMPIGMISYTLNQDELSCGYWIGSDYWNCGYMTDTFQKFLLLLKNAGFRMVSAKIAKGNIASIKIWKRCHATILEDEEYYYPKLLLRDGL